MARNGDSGVRGFVPGLVLGLVVGAFAGAVLPPLLTEQRLPAQIERGGAEGGASERRDFVPGADQAPEGAEQAAPGGEEPAGDERPDDGGGSGPAETGEGGGG